MAVRSPLINVMARTAEKAGRALVRDFGEVEQLQVSRKGPADFVSNADLKAEKTIQAELAKARPAFGFLMEESAATTGSDAGSRWIVDPLDGTTNFLHGLPHFAVSIAAEVDGELAAGVIYNPVSDELFWAERGKGAYLNDRRIRVSARRNLGEALLATGLPYKGHGDAARFESELNAVMPKVAGIRRFGAASLDLAYVAAGRFDAFWESDLSPWDIAAGIVMIQEAGGYVSEINGKRDPLGTGSVLAANPHLHLPLGKLLRDAAQPRRPTADARQA